MDSVVICRNLKKLGEWVNNIDCRDASASKKLNKRLINPDPIWSDQFKGGDYHLPSNLHWADLSLEFLLYFSLWEWGGDDVSDNFELGCSMTMSGECGI